MNERERVKDREREQIKERKKEVDKERVIVREGEYESERE